MSASQRAALHNAHAASFGYFVTQDSSFGNLILPVLPRFDSKWIIIHKDTQVYINNYILLKTVNNINGRELLNDNCFYKQ